MKKIVLSLAVLATVALASCSNNAAKSDSDSAACDSACAGTEVCDTTVAQGADTAVAAPAADTAVKA